MRRTNGTRGSREEIKSLNHYLEQTRGRLTGCYQDLQLERKLITAEGIKNKFLGIEEKEHSLLSLLEYHNVQLKETLEWGTMKNYYTTEKYIQLFLTEKLKTKDIFLSQLSYKFIVDFELFIKAYQPLDHHKPCGQNTVMKHIERFRKIINIARIAAQWSTRVRTLRTKFCPQRGRTV